jgi:hypothetical protein
VPDVELADPVGAEEASLSDAPLAVLLAASAEGMPMDRVVLLVPAAPDDAFAVLLPAAEAPTVAAAAPFCDPVDEEGALAPLAPAAEGTEALDAEPADVEPGVADADAGELEPRELPAEVGELLPDDDVEAAPPDDDDEGLRDELALPLDDGEDDEGEDEDEDEGLLEDGVLFDEADWVESLGHPVNITAQASKVTHAAVRGPTFSESLIALISDVSRPDL